MVNYGSSAAYLLSIYYINNMSADVSTSCSFLHPPPALCKKNVVIPLTHHKNGGFTELKVVGVYLPPATGGGKIWGAKGIVIKKINRFERTKAGFHLFILSYHIIRSSIGRHSGFFSLLCFIHMFVSDLYKFFDIAGGTYLVYISAKAGIKQIWLFTFRVELGYLFKKFSAECFCHRAMTRQMLRQ